MLKPFKDARLGDDNIDLKCPNPRCGQAALKYVGKDPAAYPERPKVLECQNCFSRYHVDNELHGLEYPGEPEKKNRKKEEEE